MMSEDYVPIRITSVIVEQVGDPSPGATHYEIPLQLSRPPEPEWVIYLLRAWDGQQHVAPTSRPGIEVGADRIILDGTTIDDLEQYHMQPLERAIGEANQLASEVRGKSQQKASAEEVKRLIHREHVAAVAKRLKFN
jgi:hypothetical protein